jgi:predicted enzyme related to lactoylglutathione lyase
MGAPVVHWEINSRDAQKAYDFYGNLFDWKINQDEANQYGLVDTGVKMGINGGITKAEEGANSFVTMYVQVEDPQAYLDKAVGLGATIIRPVTEIPNMVTYALFADPEGNTIGIVKGSQTPPAEKKPRKKTVRRKKKAARPKKKAAKKRRRK